METNERFVPMHAVHPFEILLDEIKAMGMRQKDFARRIGMQASNFSRMVREKHELTLTLALALERETGIPCADWMAYQESYTRDLQKIAERDMANARSMSEAEVYADKLNIPEMTKRLGFSLRPLSELVAWLSKRNGLIFGQEGAYIGNFKKSDLRDTDPKNLLSWVILALHELELNAADLHSPYRGGNALVAARELAKLANSGEWSLSRMKAILAANGIAFAHVPKMKKTPVDAYAASVGERPGIAATFRCNDMDKLTFDILHELGHIHLHMDSGNGGAFLDLDVEGRKNEMEMEADAFARDILIPPSTWRSILDIGIPVAFPQQVAAAIGRRAGALGILPSIAVARYKHDTNTYNVRAFRPSKIFQ